MDWLFDTSVFLTRLECSKGWTVSLIVSYIVPNVVITICSWYTLYIALVNWYRYSDKFSGKKSFVTLYIIYISLMGMVFLENIIVFWWVPFRFFALMLIVFAIITIFITIRMTPVIKNIFRLPSREMLFKANETAQKEVLRSALLQAQAEDKNRNLEAQVARLQKIIETNMWIHDRQGAIDEMSSIVRGLKKEIIS
jgi:hypothetical protein